ncbi:MAG: hypothetical protein KDD61_03255 [Bdellovibrionales bacterium]|nr:hypothetical protein [Bdellovibrionales bacterium]
MNSIETQFQFLLVGSDELLTGVLNAEQVNFLNEEGQFHLSSSLELTKGSFCGDLFFERGQWIAPIGLLLKRLPTELASLAIPWREALKEKRLFWGHFHAGLNRFMNHKPVCAVVGCRETSQRFTVETQRQAYSAGQMAASLGYTVLTGGLSGVMSKAAEGASSLRGSTLGILPGTEKEAANSYIQQVLPSGIGIARNYLIALACDVMVAVNGGRGTMEEMCYGLDFEKPVLSWDSWDLDESLKIDSDDHLFNELSRIRETELMARLLEEEE